MIVHNASAKPVVFIDDVGKHRLEPGAVIKVAGEQHLPMVLAIPGIAEGKPVLHRFSPPSPDKAAGNGKTRGQPK